MLLCKYFVVGSHTARISVTVGRHHVSKAVIVMISDVVIASNEFNVVHPVEFYYRHVCSDLCHIPWTQSDIQALLQNEPPAVQRPLLLRLAELKVKMHEHCGDELRPVA